MNTQEILSQTESSDTLTTLPQTRSESDVQDRLPRGSALLLETILTLSRRIKNTDDLDKAKADAASIEDMAEELVAKYKRQMGLVAA